MTLLLSAKTHATSSGRFILPASLLFLGLGIRGGWQLYYGWEERQKTQRGYSYFFEIHPQSHFVLAYIYVRVYMCIVENRAYVCGQFRLSSKSAFLSTFLPHPPGWSWRVLVFPVFSVLFFLRPLFFFEGHLCFPCFPWSFPPPFAIE